MCTKSKHLHNISYGINFMKLQFHWVPHKTWRRDGRTGPIPCGHWKDAGTFPPPNAKEFGMLFTVNWYPSALSLSLDSEEREGRVQWRGLECRVRCGMCGVLWGVGSHVGHGKVNSSCYHNSNCFDNSETTAASMATMWLCVTWGVIYLQCRYTNLHQSRLKHSCLHGNGSIIHT